VQSATFVAGHLIGSGVQMHRVYTGAKRELTKMVCGKPYSTRAPEFLSQLIPVFVSSVPLSQTNAYWELRYAFLHVSLRSYPPEKSSATSEAERPNCCECVRPLWEK